MKKRILVVSCIFILLCVMAAFAQVQFSTSKPANRSMEYQDISLEARVAALEAKVTRLEQIIQDPPVRMIPCENK